MKTQELDRVGSGLQQDELRQARRDKLLQVRRAGLFIGSVWAYGLEEGEPIFKARALWTPHRYGVDSGRTSVFIEQWASVPADGSTQLTQGTGELERHGELLMGIFESMASHGMVQLIAVPETPVRASDELTAALVQRDSRL